MRVTNTLKYTLAERDIYGSKRIGADFTPVQLIGALPVSMIDSFGRYLGMKQYEMDNHLGNVLTTVSDRKIPISLDTTTGTAVDHYEADIISSQDYYPFGMEEPGRNFNSSTYRFGFNGKLKDDDIYGAGNSYDYGARIYDPRLGAWFTNDQKAWKFPYQSPYSYAQDNPNSYKDDGNSVIPAGQDVQNAIQTQINTSFGEYASYFKYEQIGIYKQPDGTPVEVSGFKFEMPNGGKSFNYIMKQIKQNPNLSAEQKKSAIAFAYAIKSQNAYIVTSLEEKSPIKETPQSAVTNSGGSSRQEGLKNAQNNLDQVQKEPSSDEKQAKINDAQNGVNSAKKEFYTGGTNSDQTSQFYEAPNDANNQKTSTGKGTEIILGESVMKDASNVLDAINKIPLSPSEAKQRDKDISEVPKDK